MGVPQNSWFIYVYFMDNPNLKWMIWRYPISGPPHIFSSLKLKRDPATGRASTVQNTIEVMGRCCHDALPFQDGRISKVKETYC